MEEMSAEFLASKKTISGEQEKGGEISLPESYVMEKAMAAEKVLYFSLSDMSDATQQSHIHYKFSFTLPSSALLKAKAESSRWVLLFPFSEAVEGIPLMLFPSFCPPPLLQ